MAREGPTAAHGDAVWGQVSCFLQLSPLFPGTHLASPQPLPVLKDSQTLGQLLPQILNLLTSSTLGQQSKGESITSHPIHGQDKVPGVQGKAEALQKQEKLRCRGREKMDCLLSRPTSPPTTLGPKKT